MLDPEAVDAWVRDHFDHVSTEEFVANVMKYNPDLARTLSAGDLWQRALAAEQRLPKPPLETRVWVEPGDENSEIRRLVWRLLADCCLTVSSADVPQQAGVDLVVFFGPHAIVECAEDLLIPSVTFVEGKRVSVDVRNAPSPQICMTYRTPAEFEQLAPLVLIPACRLAEQHALAAGSGVNLVGQRIRFFRELQSISRAELARRVPGLTATQITALETNPDDVSNPDLLLLRRIATALNTSVTRLVEATPMDLSVLPLPSSDCYAP
ncbi:MAG TPA: helix-turn-helix transcriptional regulator [Longimicrobium sp.]|jgi:DNA-binding XRE family transcriptional regulator